MLRGARCGLRRRHDEQPWRPRHRAARSGRRRRQSLEQRLQSRQLCGSACRRRRLRVQVPRHVRYVHEHGHRHEREHSRVAPHRRALMGALAGRLVCTPTFPHPQIPGREAACNAMATRCAQHTRGPHGHANVNHDNRGPRHAGHVIDRRAAAHVPKRAAVSRHIASLSALDRAAMAQRQISTESEGEMVFHDGEVAFDSSSDAEDDGTAASEPLSFRFRWRKLWRFMGPGVMMSLAYLDPGNLESDLQLGAYTGLELLWLLWWAHAMGLVLQEMVARLGIVTGADLAQTVRREYPPWVRLVLYVMMEVAVIGADIQEVIGTAIALNLLTLGWLPVWVGCIVTALDTVTFLAVQYLGVRCACTPGRCRPRGCTRIAYHAPRPPASRPTRRPPRGAGTSRDSSRC